MITVFFATKNRSRLLSQVLESFCAIEAPATGWKLVVIDNGSSDDTPAVLQSFVPRLPLTAISEAKPGKNSALNKGLQHLEGDLAVFTDDDVFPHKEWLIRLSQAADLHPEIAMFGGAVAPHWEASPPRWIDWIDLGPVFTITDRNREEGEIHPALVFGPNMAVRSRFFSSGTCFNPSVGPRGANYAMGSESELTMRLSKQGEKAYFVPDAIVEHFIRKEQLTLPWVLRRAFRYGRGFFRLFRLWEVTEDGVGKRMDIPKPLLHEIAAGIIALAKALLSLKKEAVFRACFHLNFLRGQAMEARSLMKERRFAALSTEQAS